MYDRDAATGMLREKQSATVLPAPAGGKVAAADIHLTPDGRFLYTSERSTDTLAAFEVDGETGMVGLIGHVASEPGPRGFAIDPGGAFLLCAGLTSGRVATYAIDRASGALTRSGAIAVGRGRTGSRWSPERPYPDGGAVRLRRGRRRNGGVHPRRAAVGGSRHAGDAAGGGAARPRPVDPHPGGYARLSKSRRYDWGYATEPEPELHGRSITWPRGRVLGGSGSVNGLVYLRGSPHDYDRWAQAGARGWAWEDVLPTFRAIENWEGPAGETRGKEGKIPVSEPRGLSVGAAAFLAACGAAGFPLHRDINDGAIEGAAPVQMNVRAGRRISTAQAYLRPARARPNLRVVTGASVRRVAVEGGRATGVEAVLPGGRAGGVRGRAGGGAVQRGDRDAAPAAAVGHRRRCGAGGPRHRDGAASARRGPEPAGPSDRPPDLPHPPGGHAERDHREPAAHGGDGARLRAEPARPDGGGRHGGDAVRTCDAGRGGGRAAVPVRQLQPGARCRLHAAAPPGGDDELGSVPTGQPRQPDAAVARPPGPAGDPRETTFRLPPTGI